MVSIQYFLDHSCIILDTIPPNTVDLLFFKCFIYVDANYQRVKNVKNSKGLHKLRANYCRRQYKNQFIFVP